LETVSFGLDGAHYEIDLDPRGAKQLRAELHVFITCARSPARSTSPRSKVQTGPTPTVSIAEATAAKVLGLLASRASDANDPLNSSDPTELASRMVASIPTTHSYNALVGPFYNTSGLRTWLGLKRQALAARVSAGSLLACPTEDGRLVYPAWQFNSDGTVVPHLRDVIKILQATAASSWTIALWLRAPGGDNVDGLDAVTWLCAGKDPTPILVEARDDAARWAG